MAHPEQSLLALAMGMGAWRGKAMKTLELAPPELHHKLDAAVELMRDLGESAIKQLEATDKPSHWSDKDWAGYRRDLWRILRDLNTALLTAEKKPLQLTNVNNELGWEVYFVDTKKWLVLAWAISPNEARDWAASRFSIEPAKLAALPHFGSATTLEEAPEWVG